MVTINNSKSDERRKMYRGIDIDSGIGARIYREPSEIRRDIRDISIRIEETNSMLNVRELMMNILTGGDFGSPERLISELSAAVAEAEEALVTLRELEEEIGALREELREVKWLRGV